MAGSWKGAKNMENWWGSPDEGLSYMVHRMGLSTELNSHALKTPILS